MDTNIHIHLFSADHVPSTQVYYLLRGALHGAARELLPKLLNRSIETGDLVRLDRSLDRFEAPWPLLFYGATVASTVGGDIGLINPKRLIDMFCVVSRVDRPTLRKIFRLSDQEREAEFLAGLLARQQALAATSPYPFRDALCQVVRELYLAHDGAPGKLLHKDVWKKFLKSPGATQYKRVVVLSVNFDQAFRDDILPGLTTKPKLDFAAQMQDLEQLTRQVNAQKGPKIVPFLGLEPRRMDADEVLTFVQDNVGKDKTWRGLKIYPSMGILPTDDRLQDVFDYCQDQQIPVLSHCSMGGAGVRGTTRNFADLSDPGKWADVVQRLAKRYADGETEGTFRLCLAHFDSLELPDDVSWCDEIMNMMERTDGGVEVYSDIAFDVINGDKPRQTYTNNVARVRDRGIVGRVLFGSDWWNYVYECESEKDFVAQLNVDKGWWKKAELDKAANQYLAGVWP